MGESYIGTISNVGRIERLRPFFSHAFLHIVIEMKNDLRVPSFDFDTLSVCFVEEGIVGCVQQS